MRTNSQAQVQFQLDSLSTFSYPIVTDVVIAEPDSDFFAVTEVTGLQPNTRYFYRPIIDGMPFSPVNYFWTFPFEGSELVFSFAFGGCQQNAHDSNSFIGRVFPLIAQEQPRFFLQIGDWTYPDTTDTPQNPGNYFNVNYDRVQASYKSKYDPNYPMAQLFRVGPIDYVFDDHDYANNNSDITFPARENSLRGYKSLFPHYPLANPQHGIWHKFTFANAEFFMLDTRTQRHPNMFAFQEDSTGKLAFRPDSEHLILQADSKISGELQMDWLIRELQESTAHWKFICSSVPFNPGFRALLELILFLQDNLPDVISIPGLTIRPTDLAILLADSWHGFPNSIARLVKAVNEANVENVIVLSADSHTAAIDDGSNSLFPEIMAGALDRNNSRLVAIAEFLGIRVWNQGGQTLAQNNFNSHYGKVTVIGNQSVRLELIDEFGERLASYTVPGGHLVAKAALNYAIESRGFGNGTVGESVSQTLLLVSTAADTVFVSDIRSSSPAFRAEPKKLAVPPGQRRDVRLIFSPQTVGDFQSNLRVVSNASQSPIVISLQGKGILPSAVEEAALHIPEQFVLEQNYPNPFNASTRIHYEIARASDVTLRIFNLKGQEITRFAFSKQAPGRYFVDWRGSNGQGIRTASGVYFYVLDAVSQTGETQFKQSKKMLFLQ